MDEDGVDHDAERATELDGVDISVLWASPETRRDRGVGAADLEAALLAVLRSGGPAEKDLQGVDLPAIDLERTTVEGTDRTPLDLRGATIESLSFVHSTVRVPIDLRSATIGALTLREATIEEELLLSEASVEQVDTFEGTFLDDLEAEGIHVEGDACLDEATFDEDVTFDEATFAGDLSARAAAFYGDSNLFEDNTSLSGATIAGDLDCQQAAFGFVRFDAVAVGGRADFEEVTFTGDADFEAARFEGPADFDETRFREDASFERVAFESWAHFRGAAFDGGERLLEADATFADARVAEDLDFERARVREASFENVRVGGSACFEGLVADGAVDVEGAVFEADLAVAEGRFDGDAMFRGVRVVGPATFDGAEFHGGSNVQADADFDDAVFESTATFNRAEIETASFEGTTVGGRVDFREASIEELVLVAALEADDALLDCTDAAIRSGRIVQPADDWVRVDFTLASLGDLRLAADVEDDYRRLLDYFRFCNTEFSEFDGQTFDFAAHREYLDRNSWAIHEFHAPPEADPEFALPMDPSVVETTYLKAKQVASGDGNMKVAGEFRVKRQQYSRKKNLAVVRDGSEAPMTRLKNLARATENGFLGLTCGHGMRPMRIGAAFLFAPLIFVPPYLLGGLFETSAGSLSSLGDLFTVGGIETVFETVRFSYITYTTIGYGFLGPKGPAAELLAPLEAYLGVILSALLVYALVKRSEL
ncbi:MAG: pentapeptide repeat-containing protein [Halococcoides sp.]